MAGDWIKMRSNLRRHPKVVRIASALNADRLRTVGGLHAVWCLFDEHSEDGHLCGYTTSAVDDEIGFPGFCDQLIAVEWLIQSAQDCLKLPEFDTHNGESAKRRAQEADRKRIARKTSAESLQLVRTTSASDADKKRTREEKKREEKEHPEGFVSFWETWPASDRKEAKGKCADVWVKAKLEDIKDAILSHVESKKSSIGWTKDAGQFIPAPLVYLNQRKWEGAEETHVPAGRKVY